MKKSLLYLTSVLMLWMCGALQANAQNWEGAKLSDITSSTATTDQKTVYLYNVDTQTFLTRGGRWGTEAVLGTAEDLIVYFNVASTTSNKYQFTTQMKGAVTGQQQGYLGFTGTVQKNTTPSEHDAYNFFLDISKQHTVSYYQTYQHDNYINYTVTEVSGETNTYTLSLTYNINDSHGNTAGTYYMHGAKTACEGSTSTTGRDNYVTVTTNSDDNGTKWKFVTLKEIKEKFAQAEASDAKPVAATFLMADPDFGRNDNTISNWKTGTGSGTLSQGWVSTAPTSSSTTTYYVGNGLADSKDAGQDSNGGSMAANIHGASGKIYQTISGSDMVRAGWYEVSCNVFTTYSESGKVKLYASANGSTTAATEKTPYATADAVSGVERPTDYLAAAKLVNTATEAEGTKNYTYKAVVKVYVGGSDNSIQSLAYGVEVSDADADTWTVIDNFQLRYLGDPKSIVILDETKDDVQYMNSQNTANTSYEKSTVYLHRSLTAGKWNSLVLPFDVDNQTIVSKFGQGTQVSEFKGATNADRPNTLYFTTVNTMKAGRLYIIKPVNGEPSNGENATVKSSSDDELTLTDKFYTFESVMFGGKNVTYTKDVTDQTYTGNETYTGDTKLQFKGSWIKQATEGAVPSGSYLIKAANQQDGSGSDGVWLYLSGNDTGKTLGFRGWLEPVKSSEANAKGVTIVLDGVNDEYNNQTTAIDGLVANPENAIGGNVYNLNGQLVRANAASTEGLAKGVYIVGGKKIVVR